MRDYLACYRELNDPQKKAVDTVDGPVLVLAGPGTGKTQLLSVRAGSILKKTDVRPEHILILTYTNSAAKAMKERLGKVVGLQGFDIEVGTFHSFANSIIQESEEAANYVGDRIQMNEVEQVRAIEHILDHAKGMEPIRPFRAPYIYLDEILRKIGELKRDGITPADLGKFLRTGKARDAMDPKHGERLRAFWTVYGMYEALKEGGNREIFDERGRYDFDDMILFATQALKNEGDLSKKYRSLYRYVMVDEYQDTNGAQLELLFALLDYKRPNLCCVGDDDQSIYRFQGASVGNFKLLKERFPEIVVLSLKDNYRSAKELIEMSGKIIDLIPPKERMGQKALNAVRDYSSKEAEFRVFTTEDEELVYLVSRVRELKELIEASPEMTEEERAHPYNNIAVLVRKRSDILKIIDSFLRAGIPYATDGKEDISGERRVKQILDVLELAHIEPREYEAKDLALYKVLSADYLQIPQADILRLFGRVNARRRAEKTADITVLAEFLGILSSKEGPAGFDSPERLRSAAGIISRLLSDARAKSVHAMLMEFIKETQVYKYILAEYQTRDVLRIRELRALTSFVTMVKNSDLANPAIRLDDFLLEMKTRKDHGLPIQGELVTMTQDGVRVFTAHGSKGQEFHSVIMPFCLQNKNWPVRPIPEKIPLPSGLFRTRERAKDNEALKQLFLYDETRLFYVAMTRSRANLIFTASPMEDAVPSSYLACLDIRTEDSRQPMPEEDVMERSLETTDLKDPFIGTESVLKDMVKHLSLNPTSLNNYLTCRRKFLYDDVLMLPGPKRQSLIFGNCVHKALEETYRKLRDTEVFPPFKFFYEAFDSELAFQGATGAVASRCRAQAGTLKKWFDLAARNPVLPIGLERKLSVTLGEGIVFSGKYDKVEWEDEAGRAVRIIDYKTGKPDKHLKSLTESDDIGGDACDEYLRQLVSYKLLFEGTPGESRGRRVSRGVLVFVEPVSSDLRRLGYRKGDYATRSIEISEEMVKRLKGSIEEVWGGIMRLSFEKLKVRDEDKCRNCDFDGICWG